MLITKKNKVFDEDFPAVIKKKPRCKKPRDKFSLMYIIPIQVLSLREEVNSGGKIKRGKRLGFSVYDSLACKQCKPNKFFHKRFGLTIHNKSSHGRDSVFKMPSVPSRSFSQKRNLVGVNKRSSAAAVRGRAAAIIELIELEDDEDITEEVDEIQIVDDIGSVEEKKVFVKSIESDVKKDNDDESDDEIECVDVVEVNNENRGIKSFNPKQYLWMESSPLYQPKVFLMNSLNLKLREEVSEEDDIEEVNPLDDPNLSTYLHDNSVLVDIDEEGEVSVLGDAEIVELDEAVFEKSPHIRNLFEEEQKSKRKYIGANISPSKKTKAVYEDEMLLLEESGEDFDEEVLDIQSMLEVSMEETEEKVVNVSNDDIEILATAVDETTTTSSHSKDDENIEIVDIDVEEVPEPQVELVTLDEDDNVEVEAEAETAGKVDSIKDLVNLWASEEKSLSTQEPGAGKLRTKKRRSELKPYLTSRGL